MNAVRALERCGGVATATELLTWTTRRQIRRATRSGSITRLARGRYALNGALDARARAAGLTAVVCLRSAAVAHGWKLKNVPDRPELAVRPNRKVTGERWSGIRIAWLNLAADEVCGGVTTPLRTVLDCARQLPFDEALAIADSALRSGMVTPEELAGLRVRGAGASAVHLVLKHADGRAANPFESVLRALCIQAGIVVEAQHPIQHPRGVIHPDVACESLGLVFEGESFEFHATRKAFRRDCRRYNLLTLLGWRVFRFTWEEVMHDQAHVRWVLSLCARRVGRDESLLALGRSA